MRIAGILRKDVSIPHKYLIIFQIPSIVEMPGMSALPKCICKKVIKCIPFSITNNVNNLDFYQEMRISAVSSHTQGDSWNPEIPQFIHTCQVVFI